MDHMLELGSAMSRFVGLAERAVGEEPVPACPGWTFRDLTTHLGAMHRLSAATVLSGQRLEVPRPLVTDPIAEWYARTATGLLGALQSVSPDELVPNATRNDEQSGFWVRRQMHEATVHSVDAGQALGFDEDSWRVEPQVAADGVDEALQVLFPLMTASRKRPDVRSRIRLVATDIRESWIIAPGSGELGPPVQLHPTLDADASVSGTASELYLALWKRVGPDRLDFQGVDGRILFDGPTTP